MVFSFFPLCLPICHDLPIFFHRIWHGVYPCSSHGCHCFLLCSPMVLDGLRLKVFVDSYTVFNDCYLYFFDFYMVFIRFCLVFLDFYEASLIFTWFSSLLYGSHWFLKKKDFHNFSFFLFVHIAGHFSLLFATIWSWNPSISLIVFSLVFTMFIDVSLVFNWFSSFSKFFHFIRDTPCDICFQTTPHMRVQTNQIRGQNISTIFNWFDVVWTNWSATF